MSSRRRAPKRKVLRVDRVGAYPHVEWKHWLECQHFELRKRKAPASSIGCTACLNRVEDKEAGVDIVPDLEAEKQATVTKVQAAFDKLDLPDGFGYDTVEVEVEDVDGQAQVRSMKIQFTVPKGFSEWLKTQDSL